MCGIGGILRRDGKPIPEEWLDAIDARIAHRGPDGHGRFRDSAEVETEDGPQRFEIALIHRRLSILDAEGGKQPMVSERGRDDDEGLIAVVFNGCIYNHRELKSQLEDAGHTFASDHSDTEILIHGYREWGAELTHHLEGMYAFALWDRGKQALVLARDWFGEKPLYVRWGIGENNRIISFSSDARALADLCEDERRSRGIGIPRLCLPQHELRPFTDRYLQLGYAWSGLTIYDGDAGGVRNLPPTITNYLDRIMPKRPREALSQRDFEQLIDTAVTTRLDSDVPLGCFLSGGVDSSLIAHFAKRHESDLRTFTVRMPDERYDESGCAEEVAEYLGTDHTTLEVSIDPAEDLKFLIAVLGQPFGDSSILPAYWVSRAARQHVTVALSGDGGDELFLGYERYLAARHLNRHRRLLQWIPRRWLRRAHPKSRWHKIGRLGDMARDMRKLGIAAMESIFTQHQIYNLLGAQPQQSIKQPAGRDPMQSLRRFDLLNYLPDDLLCKVDTASMAVALEVRCPFLDRALVQAALAAPTWQLAPSGQRKGLLREIARKHLPASIVDRPKMGFAIPVGEWFRNDFGGMHTLLRKYLDGADPFGDVPILTDPVKQLLDEHMSEVQDHGQQLFALLTLAIWSDMTWRER